MFVEDKWLQVRKKIDLKDIDTYVYQTSYVLWKFSKLKPLNRNL